MLNLFNRTLQKEALQRRRQIRRLLTNGRSLQSVATQLGITRQRVHQILNANGKRKGAR